MNIWKALWLAGLSAGLAKGCVRYGAPVPLVGRLAIVDEAGYNHYTVMRFTHPICTVGDPPDEFSEPRSGISQMQVMIFDAPDKALVIRMNRLIGMRVRITGEVVFGMTGYYRTGLALKASDVVPLDAEGERALHHPKAEGVLKRVAQYDLEVAAGPRLRITARETASGSPLSPGDRYTSHWMTGGEVVYLKCLDGYAMDVLQSNPPEAGSCEDNLGCTLMAFPTETTFLRLRCTAK